MPGRHAPRLIHLALTQFHAVTLSPQIIASLIPDDPSDAAVLLSSCPKESALTVPYLNEIFIRRCV